MRHMWLCCLAICQFAIFPQAYFEPVEQFQPIWQKTKGLRHRNFVIFHQKLKLKEEKNPVHCCVCGWQGGWHSTQHLGDDREAADPGGEMELSSTCANPLEAVLPQQGFTSTNVMSLQWCLQVSAKNQVIFPEQYFVLLGLFVHLFPPISFQAKKKNQRNGVH